jgi:outer membrane receptor protein involved in Fe transport
MSRIQRQIPLFISAAAAALLVGSPAFAQQATPPAEPPAEEEEIVVTGSRIGTSAINAPQPVQVLTAETLETKGVTNVVDELATIPALQFSNTIDQSLRDGAVPGRVSLNLRALGEERTLVLVNGRRHVAGAPGTASVDVTSIPAGIVERVEVLTGGASAIYGSDAVTGVVNFITKKDFEGAQFDLQTGLSGEGDAGNIYASLLAGKNFAGGRGNITANFVAQSRSGILEGDRDWSANNGVADDYTNPDLLFQIGDPIPAGRTPANTLRRPILTNGNPTFAGTDPALVARARAAAPRAIKRDPRFSISSVSGLIGIDPFGTGFAGSDSFGDFSSTLDTNGNGTADCRESDPGRRGFGCWIIDPTTGALRPFRDGLFAGSSNQFGGDGAAQRFSGQSLTPDILTTSLNLLGQYEVNEHFTPYFELKAVENQARNIAVYKTFDDSIPITIDNPFIPASVRSLINQEIAADPSVASTIQVVMGRDNIDIINPKEKNVRRTFRGVIGANGDLGAGFKYDVSANYGRTTQKVESFTRAIDRYFASIDAVRDPVTGRTVCRSDLQPTSVPGVSIFPEVSFPGYVTFTPGDGQCKPLNLFGLGAPSAEARAFNSVKETSTATIEQTVVSAILTGDSEAFFKLPGGPVGVALGAEYREEKSQFTPDELRQQGLLFDASVERPEGGKFDVKEAFIEVNVPILADVLLADTLTVNAAARASEYSTIGRTETWKLDGVWAPIADIRFRAGKAETVRAPNISELFAPEQSATFRPIDPCDLNNIGSGPNPTNRRANCLADGIPTTFTDPLTARFLGVVSGNRNLEAETSESLTYGVVLQPSFLEGLTATVDYWDIKIDGAIAAISSQETVDACYDAPSLANPFCALFTRNRNAASPTFLGFNFLRQTLVNFQSIQSSGIDFDVRYALPLEAIGLGGWGDLDFRIAGTKVEEYVRFESATNTSTQNPELGEIERPEWAFGTTLAWSRGPLTASLFSNFSGETKLRGVEIESERNFSPNTAPSVWVHDASLRYDVNDGLTVVAGVNNILNEEPYITETNNPVSGVGRTFFVRLGATF